MTVETVLHITLEFQEHNFSFVQTDMSAVLDMRKKEEESKKLVCYNAIFNKTVAL